MYRFILSILFVVAFNSACGGESSAPASSTAASPASSAPNYPDRTITVISPNTAGTAPDLVARIFAPEMSKALGVTVQVVDKTGAQNLVGVQFVAKDQPADGYTILAAPGAALASLPATVKDVPFDPLKDIVPILAIGHTTLVLVSPRSAPWITFSEFVTNAKANPGKLSYSAASQITRLDIEIVLRAQGLNLTYVPFADTASATAAVMGGQVQLTMATSDIAANQGDKMRVLAQAGDKRIDALANVQTYAEAGAAPIPVTVNNFFVRTGTPKPIVDKLHDTLAKILQDPAVVTQLKNAGLEAERPPLASVDALSKQMATDITSFNKTAADIGMQPQ